MRKGFTLTEILVALLIFALLLGAMLLFLQNTLAASSLAQRQALLLKEAQNALGYLGEKTQEAQALLKPGFSATPQGSSTGFTCDTPQCVGLLLPVENGCQVRVWRSVPRSQVAAADKEPNPWADNNTQTVLEYRGSASCSPNTAYSNLAAAGPLVDYLAAASFTLKNASGGSTIDDANPAACLEISLQLRLRQGSRTLNFPETPLALRVYPRNLRTRADCIP